MFLTVQVEADVILKTRVIIKTKGANRKHLAAKV